MIHFKYLCGEGKRWYPEDPTRRRTVIRKPKSTMRYVPLKKN